MHLKLTAPVALVLSFFTAAQIHAAGFEKGIMIGGKSSGLAGIATPYVSGSESLYFNPAGLLVDKGVQDISLDLSPTLPSWKAPVTQNDVPSSSLTKAVVPLGLMYSRNFSEKLAAGIGYYTSAGTHAEYTGQTVSGLKGSGEARADLQVNELAIGVAYKVTPMLKVGLAYRILMADASFKVFQTLQAGEVANINFNDLSGSAYNGFKLGAQWKLNEMWSLGLNIRSNVPFKAKGNANGQILSPASPTPIPQASVEIATTLPDAYQLGAEWKMTDTWHLFGQLDYIAYSRVKDLQVSGTVGTLKDQAITLKFKDQTQIRIAAEYAGWMMPIRFGYIFTSQVSNSSYAMPGFVPPGVANTLTLGSGYAFNEALSLNGGLEYTWAKGSGSSPALTGTYQVSEIAVHLGADYAF